MLINLIKKAKKYFGKNPRIYNPSCGLTYRDWKAQTFGKDLMKRLDKINEKEDFLWKHRNREVKRFYVRYYFNKIRYAS